LLDAVTRAAGSEGYSDLTVERVLELAGVSRASFYQYFSSLDDCFEDAYRRHTEKLISDIARAVHGGDSPEFALLATLVGTAGHDPDAAKLLTIEGLAAGSVGLRLRDELVSGIERAMSVSVTNGPSTDLPASVLIGAALRFIAMRFTGSGITETALAESGAWVAAFSRRDAQLGWSVRLTPPRTTKISIAPQAPKLGRQHSARERLLAAAASTVREKGYRGMAVADIVVAAGVSRRSFYNEFANKSDVVIAAAESAFERVVEACTPAFFSARSWPERVWQSAFAFTGLFTSEPSLAHLGFVDCFSIGRAFVQRVHEMQLAFTPLLEEGYRQRGEGSELPRLCSEMTVAAMMEMGFQASRGPAGQSFRRLQPLAVYIVLTPFLGADDAAGFVVGNL
jgi:AcrR family transcriptional regulator